MAPEYCNKLHGKQRYRGKTVTEHNIGEKVKFLKLDKGLEILIYGHCLEVKNHFRMKVCVAELSSWQVVMMILDELVGQRTKRGSSNMSSLLQTAVTTQVSISSLPNLAVVHRY